MTGEDNKSSSNAGAIAGGVVGGLAFIAIVTASIFWLLSRRRIRRTQEVHTKEDSQAMTDYSSPFVYGGYTPATTPSVLPLYVSHFYRSCFCSKYYPRILRIPVHFRRHPLRLALSTQLNHRTRFQLLIGEVT